MNIKGKPKCMASYWIRDRNLFEAIKRRNQSMFGLEMVTTQSLEHVLPLIQKKRIDFIYPL